MDSIEQIVHHLGIESYVIRDEELGTLCLNPDHDDRHFGNFFINIRTGQYNCFSCGFHGSVINLLYDKGVSYTKAIKLWKIFQIDRRPEIILPARPLDKYLLIPYLNQVSSYAVKRVGSQNVLDIYGVYADNKDNPIFTTRNHKKEYTSIWVREHGKYFLLEPLNAKQSGVFFGEHLCPTDYTILTEGPFDAMHVNRVTGQKAICGFGTQLSQYQLQRLSKMHNVVLFMDGDNAGRKARKRLVWALKNKSDFYVAGGYNCDPDELSDDKTLEVMQNIKNVAEFKLFF